MTAIKYWTIVRNQIFDQVILNFASRFENKSFAQSIDSFLKLDVIDAEEFVHNYQKFHGMDMSLLKAEMAVIKSYPDSNKLSFKEAISQVTPDTFPNTNCSYHTRLAGQRRTQFQRHEKNKIDRKSTRLNSSHRSLSRMPSSA